MQTTPLHDRFGVEISGIDLNEVDAEHGYAEIRRAFETHSLLCFPAQQLDDAALLRIAGLFGPIEDRTLGAHGATPPVPKVSNLGPDNAVIPDSDPRVLTLKANQLWHTDSTFLPVPSLINLISARVMPSTGGETELVSTREAWRDMPAGLKERARNAVFLHRYSHSRAKISAELAKGELFTMWPDQAWRAIWPNPVNGEESLYIASHVYGVRGMPDAEGGALIEELTAWCTQPHYVYTHSWQIGDTLIWDERATMHRGRPWPYEQERTLASLCASVRDVDGFAAVRA